MQFSRSVIDVVHMETAMRHQDGLDVGAWTCSLEKGREGNPHGQMSYEAAKVNASDPDNNQKTLDAEKKWLNGRSALDSQVKYCQYIASGVGFPFGPFRCPFRA